MTNFNAVAHCVVLLCNWTCAGNSSGQDVAWLADVNTPPPVIRDTTAGRLDPLLINQLSDDSADQIANLDQWQEKRKQLQREWYEFLGPMPEPRPELQLQVLSSELIGEVTRQLIRYQCEPELYVEAYLLIPRAIEGDPREYRPSMKHAAVVALHPTTDVSIDEIAGVSGRDHMHSGLKLAQQGFVVICPRCFLWQDASSLNDAVAQHRQRHPTTLGMAKMLYDASRAVDVLESLPAVIAEQIGAFGHSLGAKEVLYLAAFDERIKAAVASEGGLGYRSTNWNAPWYLGPAIDDPAFPLNHHQLLAMIAPRPFLVLGGEAGPGAADGVRSWAIIEPALPVWKLYGHSPRIGLLNHRQGHYLSPESFDRTVDWLRTYLQ